MDIKKEQLQDAVVIVTVVKLLLVVRLRQQTVRNVIGANNGIRW